MIALNLQAQGELVQRRPFVAHTGSILGLLLLFTLSWIHQHHYDFEHDDAYISYRYAANWAAGLGPVFNVGERVEGYTNFLHVFALKQCAELGLDIVQSARLIGTLSSFAVIVLSYAFVVRRLQRSWLQALFVATAVATHAALATWARSGLETVPFTLMVFVAIYVFTGELARQGVHLASGALFGVASLIRADGFILAIVTLAFLLLRTRSPKRLGSFALAFALVCGPSLVWRIGYYGYPFPNSYYLKVGGGIFQQIRGLFYAYNFIEPFGGLALFGLPLTLLLLRDQARNEVRFYLAFIVLAFTGYVVWVGGDHMPMCRFFVPLVVPLALLFTESANELGRLCELHRKGSARFVLPSLFLVVIASGIAPTLNQRRLPASYVIGHKVLVRQWAMAGAWLRDHVAASTLMATEPAGAVAYLSGLRIVDMLGVNDLHIAHLEVAGMGRHTAGHEKRDMPYVLSRQPQLIFRGVRPLDEKAGTVTTYEDGSRYRLRCEALGLGPIADEFGSVKVAELFLWLEERLP